MISTTMAPARAHTVRLLGELFAPGMLEHVGFRLWDGTRWPDESPRRATLVLKHPESLRAMLAEGTEKGLAEAYLRDDFDVEGDLETACTLSDRLQPAAREDSWLVAAKRGLHLHRWTSPGASGRAWSALRDSRLRPHSRERDRNAVTFHYDVSNEFYRLWLDSRMLYSCAYFEQATDGLETAQTAKLRHLCRKLRLRSQQRLLDIGCGWGGLAAFAAQRCGVQVDGITLSEQQALFASTLIGRSGLASDVGITLKDYRDHEDLRGYDAIVSVGMAEHVGAKHLPEYFEKVYSLLKPGGVFLNHAIGDGPCARPDQGTSFIQDYVFPDSDVPPIARMLTAAEATGFEVRDVENLREHYTLTLRHWVRRLEASRAAALQLVNEPTYRTWRLYLAGSAHGFDCGRLAVYQTLLVKPDGHGRAHLPLTRRDWYKES